MNNNNTKQIRIILLKMERRNNILINHVSKSSLCMGLLVFISIIVFILYGVNTDFTVLIISTIGSLFTFLVASGVLVIYIIKSLSICSHQCDLVISFLNLGLYEKVESSLDEIDCTNKMNVADLKELLPTIKLGNNNEE